MKKLSIIILSISMLVLILSGCSKSGLYKDGSYTGTGRGASSDIKTAVEVKNGKIASIKILEHHETQGLIDPVEQNILPEIIKKQTTEGIDAIAGATNSSKGVITAVNDALSQAKK